ncbi:hypothetical protein JCM8115_003295 [Rhodotorula mucilaginosa]
MVGTHLLPPNLLKLFAPRPPLPYLKPPGRDPDFPLKSLSSKRAPKPILVSEVLEEIRAQQATEEADRDADVVKQDGTAPVKPKHEEQEQEEDNKPEVKAESASQQPAASDGEDATMTSATSTDEKEEGEEAAPPIAKSADAAAPTTTTTAAAAETQSQQKRLTKKPKGPVAGERDDLTAETRFELRRREKKRWQQECMSKPYAPQDDEEICGDPYKTLFVGRLPREVTEKDLLREFELYGPIDRLRLVVDPETGLSRGYAFIVYERERDMKAAYKDADGLKMKGKRLLIDVERGRTVKGWKPRRLGGGLGGRIKKLKGGIPAPEPSAFPPPYMGGGGPPGGFGGRGGFGGGGFGGGRGGGFAPRGGRGGFMGGGRGGYGGGFGGPPRGGPPGGGGGFGGGFQGGFQGGGGGGFAPMDGGGGGPGGPPPPGGGGGYGPPGGGRGGFQGGGIGYGGVAGAPPRGGGGPPGGGGGGGYPPRY